MECNETHQHRGIMVSSCARWHAWPERKTHTHSLVCWMMALNSIFGSITSIPFMPQIMMLSCCLCNLARAAGQSTACPKLYNLQLLGKLNREL